METPSKYMSDITNIGLCVCEIEKCYILVGNIYESNFVAGHDVWNIK